LANGVTVNYLNNFEWIIRLSLVKFYLIYLLIEKAKSLEESAREFQAKYEKKTELKEVEIKTGEEDI
jgi:energy-converting hydrogenase Eha subunit H